MTFLNTFILIFNKYPVFHHSNEKYCGCESQQCSLLPYDMKALNNFNFYPEEGGGSYL